MPRNSLTLAGSVVYFLFCAALTFAHRAFCAAEILALAAADIFLRFGTVAVGSRLRGILRPASRPRRATLCA